MRIHLLPVLLLIASCRPPGTTPATAPAPVTANTLHIELRPIRARTPQVAALAVREEIRGVIDQTRPFSLRVPIVYVSRGGIADRVDSLLVRDAQGVIPLRIENDPPSAGGYTSYRHFRAERAVQTPITVTYRMRPAPRPTGGPQFEFYAHGGGISAHGSQMFVLPERFGVADIRVRWDLSELDERSTAAATLGEGDLRFRGRPDELVGSFYMAGPMGVFEPPKDGTGFKLWWLGRPAYDPRVDADWLFQAYENMRKFFRDQDASPFRMFTRAVGYGGGTASARSFMAAVDSGSMDATRKSPRVNHAHEISHYFVGGLQGDSAGGTPWYTEGMNTHYTRLLLMRAGLIPVSEYLTGINEDARSYYANPFRDLSSDSIRRIGFSTGFGRGGAQNLAYTRGSLFWADVDTRIRETTSGRRKLDDVLVPLLIERKQGKPFTVAVLFNALAQVLGPSIHDHYHAVLVQGELLHPVSQAFGRCLQRKDTTYVEAGGSGRQVPGYVWQRVAGVPDEVCRTW